MPDMKKTFAIFFMLCFSFIVKAQFQAEITKGNTAYQAGFYENAAQLYEKVISQGFTSSELYYNLGNAYFKAGNYPSAILNYERALRLDPGNEDIQYNLRVANNQIIDKIDQLPQIFYERWWQAVKQFNSPDGWALLTLILFVIFFIVLGWFLLSTSVRVRRTLLPIAFVLLFLSGVFLILAGETHSEVKNHKDAIVFEATLPVKSSPEESGIDLFVIHEGLKVEVIDELSGWKEIRIANGSKGWVKEGTIRAI